MGDTQSRRKRNLTHEWVHEWPHEEAPAKAPARAPTRADFPVFSPSRTPHKKHPTKVSTEGPTSGRSGFTCRVLTCSVLWPYQSFFQFSFLSSVISGHCVFLVMLRPQNSVRIAKENCCGAIFVKFVVEGGGVTWDFEQQALHPKIINRQEHVFWSCKHMSFGVANQSAWERVENRKFAKVVRRRCKSSLGPSAQVSQESLAPKQKTGLHLCNCRLHRCKSLCAPWVQKTFCTLFLSVKSPALILSKNSGVILAKVG